MWNKIGDVGAEHVAVALKVNQVRALCFMFRRYFTLAIIADPQNTESWKEQYR